MTNTKRRGTTTAEVREAFQHSGDGLDFKRVFNERGEDFDQWLAEVRADALREAALVIRDYHSEYDAALLLEARADEIERAAS